MKAVATRYSGFFTTNIGGVPTKLPRVRHFEIWNEANLKNFFRFNNSSNVGKYKGLVKQAYKHQGGPAERHRHRGRAGRAAAAATGTSAPRCG